MSEPVGAQMLPDALNWAAFGQVRKEDDRGDIFGIRGFATPCHPARSSSGTACAPFATVAAISSR
ncbi:hypothetical protein, partial [Stenotrophomonas maltophilia]|uniref:hypothetical protein n=1 Tax=Stenotrophomonas maltophilia TaxID=40324 RepID=UPI0019532989